MSLSADDRLEIGEVIAMHGHLCDATAYERFDEVFAPDLVVDTSDLGLAPLPPGDPSRSSLENYIAVATRLGAGKTAAMHVTNVVVAADGDDARASSKGFTVSKDGAVASFSYTDRLVRTDRGWRISHRKVSPHREPGSGIPPVVR